MNQLQKRRRLFGFIIDYLEKDKTITGAYYILLDKLKAEIAGNKSFDAGRLHNLTNQWSP